MSAQLYATMHQWLEDPRWQGRQLADILASAPASSHMVARLHDLVDGIEMERFPMTEWMDLVNLTRTLRWNWSHTVPRLAHALSG